MTAHSKLPAIIAIACSLNANAQGLADSFKAQQWNGLVFVSTTMPRLSILEIAREAALTKTTIVLRGFDARSGTLNGAQEFIRDINSNCCGKTPPPGWIVHPKLFEQYGVKKVPAYVLSKGTNPGKDDVGMVSGDIGIANALKFLTQLSVNQDVRFKASEIYTKSFGGH